MREVRDGKEWNELVLKNSPRSGGFLGSWEWGEFQARVGKAVKRFVDGNQWAQIVEQPLPFGKKYWYVPRGGSIKDPRALAAQHGVFFIRYEPVTRSEVASDSFPTVHVSPPTTLIVDLTKSEAELLAAMHEKTRYNIRLAERKGVKCQRSNVKGFNVFWDLLEETARRDGFRTHARSYYERMLEIPWVELWTAEWDGKVLAAGLWACFGDTVTYLHGASSSEERNVMAPYLLHWQVMADVKRRGFKAYDFWGVSRSEKQTALLRAGEPGFVMSREARPRNPGESRGWAGMTRFKTGFGGEVVEYPGTFDLPIAKFWYRIYKLIRTALRAGR